MDKMKQATPKRVRKPRWRTTRMPETEGVFLLKVVMYIALASFWLKFGTPIQIGAVALNGIPLGFLVGLYVASRERRQINRKIAYATLIIITILCYFFPAGVVI